MSDTKNKNRIKDKYRIPIEINVNDDISRNRYFLSKYSWQARTVLTVVFRLKYHAAKKKDDMFERIDRDVELAIADYKAALLEEDKAQVSYHMIKNILVFKLQEISSLK